MLKRHSDRFVTQRGLRLLSPRLLPGMSALLLLGLAALPSSAPLASAASSTQSDPQGHQALLRASSAFHDIAQRATPAVVSIEVTRSLTAEEKALRE